jgi:hypothetical protein
MAALFCPLVAGVNVTKMVQLAFAPNVVPHVVVCAKSAGSKPPKKGVLMTNDVEPSFMTVTFFATLGVPMTSLENDSRVGESMTNVC